MTRLRLMVQPGPGADLDRPTGTGSFAPLVYPQRIGLGRSLFPPSRIEIDPAVAPGYNALRRRQSLAGGSGRE